MKAIIILGISSLIGIGFGLTFIIGDAIALSLNSKGVNYIVTLPILAGLGCCWYFIGIIINKLVIKLKN